MLKQHREAQPTAPALACAPRIAVRYRAIAELKLDPANPRLHSKKQVRQIAASIAAFGFNVPILVDAQSKVVAGHGRILACLELGLSEVPTICLDHLSVMQAKAFLIADNRLTENATWDEPLLAQQLKELCLAELDFSIEATGFEMGEIDVLIENVSPAPLGEDDPADALPPPGGPAVTQPGDLWLLGSHRLLCANALEPSAYAALMAKRKAAVVFTDAPYNVPITGHVSGKGAVEHREFAMACGEMSGLEFTAFLTQVCELLAQHSVDGAIHYHCMDWRHLAEILAAGRRVYSELKNVCIWVKDNAGLGSLYRSQHELILVWKHGTAAHHNNIQLGQFGRNRSNVWRYPGVNSFGRNSEEGNLLALHPTVKPVALVADALLDCSARADIVLDPFLGSGTTLIAAERSGRVNSSMELDALYVDTAIRRWQRFTGLKARLGASGIPFEQLEQRGSSQAEVAHG
jgi:DNA modification methylase